MRSFPFRCGAPAAADALHRALGLLWLADALVKIALPFGDRPGKQSYEQTMAAETGPPGMHHLLAWEANTFAAHPFLWWLPAAVELFVGRWLVAWPATLPAGDSRAAPDSAVTPRLVPGCGTAPGLFTNRVASEGYSGGIASMDVPWPPRPGGALLRQVTAELRATPSLTVHERVTSDTTLGPGIADTATLSGSRYLATEPYEAGIAPVAVRFPAAGGQVLLLGYPAQDFWVRLTIGTGDRITAETLTDPDHLITRTFSYPEKLGPR